MLFHIVGKPGASINGDACKRSRIKGRSDASRCGYAASVAATRTYSASLRQSLGKSGVAQQTHTHPADMGPAGQRTTGLPSIALRRWLWCRCSASCPMPRQSRCIAPDARNRSESRPRNSTWSGRTPRSANMPVKRLTASALWNTPSLSRRREPGVARRTSTHNRTVRLSSFDARLKQPNFTLPRRVDGGGWTDGQSKGSAKHQAEFGRRQSVSVNNCSVRPGGSAK